MEEKKTKKKIKKKDINISIPHSKTESEFQKEKEILIKKMQQFYNKVCFILKFKGTENELKIDINNNGTLFFLEEITYLRNKNDNTYKNIYYNDKKMTLSLEQINCIFGLFLEKKREIETKILINYKKITEAKTTQDLKTIDYTGNFKEKYIINTSINISSYVC